MSLVRTSVVSPSRFIDYIGVPVMRLHAQMLAGRAFSKPDAPPILVYQMGKVASSTVCASLKGAGIPNSILHLHFLSEDLPQHIEAHKKAGVKLLPYHLLLGEAVRKLLLERHEKSCKVISLVRDPIALVISDIFQNPKFIKEDIENQNGEISAEKVSAYLHQRLSEPDVLRYQDDWFNNEIKRVFGIDVFAQPFASDIGYQTYIGNHVELLLIRVEDLSRKGPTAISKFLGMTEPLKMKQRNIRNKTKGPSEYESLLRNFRLDESLCREIYARRLVSHIYSEEMIEGFISRWANQVS